MQTDTANVAALREAYRRWAETRGGSIDDWIDLCSENIQFRSLAEGAPGLEFTTARRTRSDVASYLTALVAQWEMLHYEVENYVAEGNRVVAIGHCSWRHRGTGKVVDTPKVDLWRFRDGRAVEFFEFTTRLACWRRRAKRATADTLTGAGAYGGTTLTGYVFGPV